MIVIIKKSFSYFLLFFKKNLYYECILIIIISTLFNIINFNNINNNNGKYILKPKHAFYINEFLDLMPGKYTPIQVASFLRKYAYGSELTVSLEDLSRACFGNIYWLVGISGIKIINSKVGYINLNHCDWEQFSCKNSNTNILIDKKSISPYSNLVGFYSDNHLIIVNSSHVIKENQNE